MAKLSDFIADEVVQSVNNSVKTQMDTYGNKKKPATVVQEEPIVKPKGPLASKKTAEMANKKLQEFLGMEETDPGEYDSSGTKESKRSFAIKSGRVQNVANLTKQVNDALKAMGSYQEAGLKVPIYTSAPYEDIKNRLSYMYGRDFNIKGEPLAGTALKNIDDAQLDRLRRMREIDEGRPAAQRFDNVQKFARGLSHLSDAFTGGRTVKEMPLENRDQQMQQVKEALSAALASTALNKQQGILQGIQALKGPEGYISTQTNPLKFYDSLMDFLGKGGGKGKGAGAGGVSKKDLAGIAKDMPSLRGVEKLEMLVADKDLQGLGTWEGLLGETPVAALRKLGLTDLNPEDVGFNQAVVMNLALAKMYTETGKQLSDKEFLKNLFANYLTSDFGGSMYHNILATASKQKIRTFIDNTAKDLLADIGEVKGKFANSPEAWDKFNREFYYITGTNADDAVKRLGAIIEKNNDMRLRSR